MTDKPIPTEAEQLKMYRGFLHDLNTFAAIVMDHHAVHDLIGNACDWSYAHRCGNGVPTDEEQDQIIANNFWKLRDVTPKEERKEKIMKENHDALRNSEIEKLAKELLTHTLDKYKVESVDNLTCPIMKKLYIAINGTDEQLSEQVTKRFSKNEET